MIQTKAIGDINIGDYICDMHYGLEPLQDRFDVVSHLRWDEPRRSDHKPGYVDHGFFDYLQQFTEPRMYINKLLHVIAFDDKSTLSEPILICAYCYDGRRSGIVVLKAKHERR